MAHRTILPLTRAATVTVAAATLVALGTGGGAAAARSIQPYRSTPVKPVGSTPVKPVGSTPVKQGSPAGSAASAAAAAAAPSSYATPKSLVGTWHTWVPGGAVQHGVAGDPNVVVQETSGPAGGKPLAILADGRYSWRGTTGRWQATGDRDYPIVLLNVSGGRDWKVGAASASVRQSQKAQIVLYDGFTSYMGKR